MQTVTKKPYTKPELFCIVSQVHTAAGKHATGANEVTHGTCATGSGHGNHFAGTKTRGWCVSHNGVYHATVSVGTAS